MASRRGVPSAWTWPWATREFASSSATNLGQRGECGIDERGGELLAAYLEEEGEGYGHDEQNN